MKENTEAENFNVSVVLPSYNEKDNIIEAIERISLSLGEKLLEIIVVDDNSPDGTWRIVQEMDNPKTRVIRRMNERGLASALAMGISEAKGNAVVWLDCDLGIPPEEIPRLVEKLKDYDVAIGSRYVEGGKDLQPKQRALASVMINLFASLLLGFNVRDYTSGFAAVRKEVFETVKLSNKGFGEYFIEFAYRCTKNNFRIAEVGYIYRRRKSGISQLDGSIFTLLGYGIQYGFKVIKLKFTV